MNLSPSDHTGFYHNPNSFYRNRNYNKLKFIVLVLSMLIFLIFNHYGVSNNQNRNQFVHNDAQNTQNKEQAKFMQMQTSDNKFLNDESEINKQQPEIQKSQVEIWQNDDDQLQDAFQQKDQDQLQKESHKFSNDEQQINQQQSKIQLNKVNMPQNDQAYQLQDVLQQKILISYDQAQKQKQKEVTNIQITYKNEDYDQQTRPYVTPLPKAYKNIDNIKYKELPFCIISRNLKIYTFQSIKQSLIKQNYTNYNLYYTMHDDTKPQNEPQTDLIHYISSSNLDKGQFQSLKQIINNYCEQNSIIFLIKSPLKQKALKSLNKQYQQKNIWMTYFSSNYRKNHGIQSFYSTILLNTINNDFNKKKVIDIYSGNIKMIALSMLKLAQLHCVQISIQNIYQFESQPQIVFQSLDNFTGTLKKDSEILGIRQRMFTLSQNYRIKKTNDPEKYYEKLVKKLGQRYQPMFQITQKQMHQAIQYVQIKSLPLNHSLNDRQANYYQQKYKIFDYKQQLPICVVMPTFNNVQNQRYKKSLMTVFQQNYNNYHIALLDDASTDSTINLSKKYVQSVGKQKFVHFIRNQGKKYATYNIYNGVHNYCRDNDIIALVDGDDQLVGRQVFKFINAIYQSGPYWIVYTNYMRSDYTYGGSRKVQQRFFDGQRFKYHVMSPLRTFYRKLYLKIEEKDHKTNAGIFLDTLYDQAMQYPLFQMAGIDHLIYVPQITYFYNTNYGNNDDSTKKKVNRRHNIHQQIVSRPRYQRVQSLS